MQKQINQVLQRELTRKEFLKAIGLGIMALIGLSTLHRILSGQDLSNYHKPKSNMGYGSTPYGN